MEGETSLRSRSLRSAGWRLGASLAGAMVLFVRAVMLARLVEVETFGVYALSFALVSLSAVLAEFGLGEAFLHRAPDTADEDRAARAHFGWNLLLTVGWATLAAVMTLLVATPAMVEPLLVLIAARAGLQLARTPSLILVRRVEQRRLATIDLMTAVATTVVAVGLAAAGAELWALLATDLVTAAVALVALYAWRPVWHPRLDFSPATSRYFLGFGSRGLAASALTQMLERIDNLWTGLALGKVALGYYSRAFTFATYPRRLATQPILAVVEGTFAELKGDPDRLRKAFLNVTFFLTRLGVMAAGLLAVVGEDFVVVLLGPRWLPMLPAFRILLVLAVVTPVERSLAALFVAIGEPGRVAIARSIQLVVVMLGLLAVGRSLGTGGVATAVVFGELAAAAVLWVKARRLLRSSIIRLAAAPLMATGAAAALCLAAVRPAAAGLAALPRLGLMASVFVLVFLAASWLLDRSTLRDAAATLGSLRTGGPGAGPR